MPAYKAGTTYKSMLTPQSNWWTAMGSPGNITDVYGMVEPDDNTAWLNQVKGLQTLQQTDQSKQKFDLFKDFLGKLDLGGSSNSNVQIRGGSGSAGAPVPAPRYASYSPVYSQGQVDAQAGLQRAALLNQAQQNTRNFTQDLGSRGFSPLSPFSMLAGQSNIMRANAGAASNETNLNFQAAGANSDAKAKTDATNAQVYGDYARSVAAQNQLNQQNEQYQASLHQDMLKLMLSGLSSL